MGEDIKVLVLYPWNIIESIKLLMVSSPWFLCTSNCLIMYYTFFVNFMFGKCLLFKNAVEFIIIELKLKFVGKSVP